MAITIEEAIKRLLAAVGESTELTSGDNAYDMAQDTINIVTKEVLSLGWSFNTTYDSEGKISSISTSTSFASVPEYVQQYIIARAIQEFAIAYTGENTFSQDYLAITQQAYINARNQDSKRELKVDIDKLRDAVISELKGEGYTSATSYASETNGLLKQYADVKAKRQFLMLTAMDPTPYIQPTQEEQELYLRIVKSHSKESLDAVDFDTLKASIEAQVLNEFGMWYNTVFDSDGVHENIPASLPGLAAKYAEVKAKRMYVAYTNGNYELLANPTPEEQELYQQMLRITRASFGGVKDLETFKAAVWSELKAEGYTNAADYASETDGLILQYTELKARRHLLALIEPDPTPYLQPSNEEQEMYQRILQNYKRTLVSPPDATTIANAVATLTGLSSADADVQHYATMKANRLKYAYEAGNMEALLQVPQEEVEVYQGLLLRAKREALGTIDINTLETDIKNSVVATLSNLNTTDNDVVEYAKLKSRRLYMLYQEADVNYLQPSQEELALYNQLMLRHVRSFVNGDSLDTIKTNILKSLEAEGINTTSNDLANEYADIKAKRLMLLYNAPDPTPYVQPSNDELELYQRLLKEQRKAGVGNVTVDSLKTDIKNALIAEGFTDSDLVDLYTTLKARRLYMAYTSLQPEAYLQPTQEESEIYQRLLLVKKSQGLSGVDVSSLKTEIKNAMIALGFADDDYLEHYASVKARRLHLMYTEPDPSPYLQPDQAEQEAYTVLLREQLKAQTGTKTYDDVLSEIETQLKNETGWWFNTAHTLDGSIEADVPVTLPTIVQQYAEAKAKRIYTAYTTGQYELLINPTPEEQELYSKMLELNARNNIKAKSLDKLRDEITIELLAEGWDFNTIEDTYANIKANYGLDNVIKIEPKYIGQYNIYMSKDTNGDPIVIDRKTGVELADDAQVRVYLSMSYAELPALLKQYIDLKTTRLYKHYNDEKNTLAFAQPTPEEMQMYWRIRGVYKTSIENHNMLDSEDYGWYY